MKKSSRKISRKIAPERVLAKSQENRSVLKLQIDICMFTTFLFLEIISAGVGNVMAVLKSWDRLRFEEVQETRGQIKKLKNTNIRDR